MKDFIPSSTNREFGEGIFLTSDKIRKIIVQIPK